jgi:hypothetical protein
VHGAAAADGPSGLAICDACKPLWVLTSCSLPHQSPVPQCSRARSSTVGQAACLPVGSRMEMNCSFPFIYAQNHRIYPSNERSSRPTPPKMASSTTRAICAVLLVCLVSQASAGEHLEGL